MQDFNYLGEINPRKANCPRSYGAFIRFNVPLADSMCTDMYPYLYYTVLGEAILIFLSFIFDFIFDEHPAPSFHPG
jgi:uncharacterized membrane protein YwaF